MGRQLSPFAELTGDEKQIRWLEYQSLRLPYIQTEETTADATPAISAAKDELVSPEEYILRNSGDFSKKVYGDVYME